MVCQNIDIMMKREIVKTTKYFILYFILSKTAFKNGELDDNDYVKSYFMRITH